jgi:hypothetical protein
MGVSNDPYTDPKGATEKSSVQMQLAVYGSDSHVSWLLMYLLYFFGSNTWVI